MSRVSQRPLVGGEDGGFGEMSLWPFQRADGLALKTAHVGHGMAWISLFKLAIEMQMGAARFDLAQNRGTVENAPFGGFMDG